MQQSGFKMNNILKKLGAYCTFLIQDSTTPSDTFYQESTTTYKEVKYWAVVLPARAYDLHSKCIWTFRVALELNNLVSLTFFINIQDGDTIVLNRDYYVDNVGKYQIVGKEIFGTSYYLLEAHLEIAL